MNAMDVVNRLLDRRWRGIDGKGRYDVVMFLGTGYILQSQLLAALKHFAPDVRTLSLDPFYQPNADFSFPNLDERDWEELFRAIIESLRSRR